VPYVRLSIARPRPGQEQRLEEIMAKLNDISRGQPGCLEVFLLKPHDQSGEIARISVYEDEAAAATIANSDSVLSLRSEMHLACEPGHTERAFFSI
jgi:quinol monooxygenase YgiN